MYKVKFHILHLYSSIMYWFMVMYICIYSISTDRSFFIFSFFRSHPVKGSAHLLFTCLLLYLKHSSWATESIISSKEVPSILSALWKRLVVHLSACKKYSFVVRTHMYIKL